MKNLVKIIVILFFIVFFNEESKSQIKEIKYRKGTLDFNVGFNRISNSYLSMTKISNSENYQTEINSYIDDLNSKTGINLGIAYKLNFGSYYSFGLGTNYLAESCSSELFGDVKMRAIEFSNLHEIKFKSIGFVVGPIFKLPLISMFNGNETKNNDDDKVRNLNLLIGLSYNTKKGFYTYFYYTRRNDFAELVIDEEYVNYPKYDYSNHVSSFKFGIGYNIKFKKKEKKKKEDSKYIQPVVRVITDYSEYSDSRLEELLKLANTTENYDKATYIQQEIDKRAKQNTYINVSTEELNKMLEKAIFQEDYETAEIIQKEINKRK